MKETKEQLVEKILTYMKKKGEIIDKLMVKYAVESFYTEKDKRALKRLLLRQDKNQIKECIDDIVAPGIYGKDEDICPFCFFFFGENGICVGEDSENSTYGKISKVLDDMKLRGIYRIEEIQDLIKNTF